MEHEAVYVSKDPKASPSTHREILWKCCACRSVGSFWLENGKSLPKFKCKNCGTSSLGIEWFVQGTAGSIKSIWPRFGVSSIPLAKRHVYACAECGRKHTYFMKHKKNCPGCNKELEDE